MCISSYRPNIQSVRMCLCVSVHITKVVGIYSSHLQTIFSPETHLSAIPHNDFDKFIRKYIKNIKK